MQQRAAICRALNDKPKMLLLDEPFGALDAFRKEELWCLLRDLWTVQRFNVILVTHDLRESVFPANTVYVMNRSPGRFVVKREIGLPRSMPYFYGSLKVAITLAFVGTTVSEMTASNEGIGYLLISAGSSMQMGLAFSGLLVVGVMAMAMYDLLSLIEKRTTGWAHRGSQGE